MAGQLFPERAIFFCRTAVDFGSAGATRARTLRADRQEAVTPTVAWPSEAVRVGDESIAFIHKRVEDPFYKSREALLV